MAPRARSRGPARGPGSIRGACGGVLGESRGGLVEGLVSPHPIAPTLPSIYQDDELTLRLVGAFDESIAPVLLTPDTLPPHPLPRALRGRLPALARSLDRPRARRELNARPPPRPRRTRGADLPAAGHGG